MTDGVWIRVDAPQGVYWQTSPEERKNPQGIGRDSSNHQTQVKIKKEEEHVVD